MSWGEELHSAIERHDTAALRSMVEQAGKQETRMIVNLLADMIEHQPKKTPQLKKIA